MSAHEVRCNVGVRPLAGACGALVDGVDLSRALDDATLAQIKAASTRHLVIFFTDQYLAFENLSPGMQRLLRGLRVVFSDASLAKRNEGRSMKVHPDADERGVDETVHLAVRTHPATGREALG